MKQWKLVLLGAFVACSAATAIAQDSTSATAATSSASSDKPTKKVWTNDDVPGLRAGPSISTSVVASPKPAQPVAQKPGLKGRDAKWYRDQIAKLQVQLPPLDGQIAELQSALDGKPTGDAKSSQRPRGVKQDDWSLELAELQVKRDAILAKINALQDEARRNGVPDNALP